MNDHRPEIPNPYFIKNKAEFLNRIGYFQRKKTLSSLSSLNIGIDDNIQEMNIGSTNISVTFLRGQANAEKHIGRIYTTSSRMAYRYGKHKTKKRHKTKTSIFSVSPLLLEVTVEISDQLLKESFLFLKDNALHINIHENHSLKYIRDVKVYGYMSEADKVKWLIDRKLQQSSIGKQPIGASHHASGLEWISKLRYKIVASKENRRLRQEQQVQNT